VHMAAAGAGFGHQRAVPARQLPVAGQVGHGGQPGRVVWRGSRRDQAAAQLRRGLRDEPPQPGQLAADLIQAGAHRRRGLHLEPHQLLLHPRLPAKHPQQTRGREGNSTGGTVQEHELLLHAHRDPAGRARRTPRVA
jgi:hypothetical protein